MRLQSSRRVRRPVVRAKGRHRSSWRGSAGPLVVRVHHLRLARNRIKYFLESFAGLTRFQTGKVASSCLLRHEKGVTAPRLVPSRRHHSSPQARFLRRAAVKSRTDDVAEMTSGDGRFGVSGHRQRASSLPAPSRGETSSHTLSIGELRFCYSSAARRFGK